MDWKKSTQTGSKFTFFIYNNWINKHQPEEYSVCVEEIKKAQQPKQPSQPIPYPQSYHHIDP